MSNQLYYNFDFDSYDLELIIKVFCEREDFIKTYRIQLKNEYLMENDFSIDNVDLIFGYTLDLNGTHFLNNKEFDIQEIKEIDLKKILFNMIILRNDAEHDLVKNNFTEAFIINIDTLQEDLTDCFDIISFEMI